MKKFLIIVVAIMAMIPASGAGKRAFTIEDLYRVRSVSGATLSPDGQKIAYSASQSDLRAVSSSTNIYLMNADGSSVRPLTTDGKSSSPVWSKDGKSLFFSTWISGKNQVYRYDFATGMCEKLTDYALGITAPVISPDNNLIAFVARVYPDLGGEKPEENAARVKKNQEGPLQAHIADQLLYRHWTEWFDGQVDHIVIYNISEKTYKDVTPGEWFSPQFVSGGTGEFTFSPDSKSLCYVSNHTEHQEANTNSDIWVVPVGGGEPRNLTEDNLSWDGSPAYSPDGKYIAYRFQTIPAYESDRFRLGLIEVATGKKTVLTESFDNWVEGFSWAADGKSIFFLGAEKGYQPLFKVDIARQKISKVIADRAIGSFEVDKDGKYAYYTYSTTGKPSAYYRMDLGSGKEQQLSFLNQQLEDEVDIRPSEKMWVKGAKGEMVEVFIVKPHGFDPSKKYPLVINVHGGPQMQWMDSFRGDWQVYPGAGYVVAYPNPHGSTGYGQAFTRAISEDWGGSPYEDVMKVTDALEKLPYVDADRIGIMGWSYGGYFMNWVQGHTKRYKCIATMMGLYDLNSMWGTTEELWFPNFDLGGQPWNSELYKKWSPSQYVENFATPTLIMTGERDYRVSYTQSLQYFSVLQTLGIPSRLIVLKNDGHWPDNLRSMPLYYNAHLEWFHKYLGGDPAPWNSEQMVRDGANCGINE